MWEFAGNHPIAFTVCIVAIMIALVEVTANISYWFKR